MGRFTTLSNRKKKLNENVERIEVKEKKTTSTSNSSKNLNSEKKDDKNLEKAAIEFGLDFVNPLKSSDEIMDSMHKFQEVIDEEFSN